MAEVRYASVGRRFLALLVDNLLFVLLVAPLIRPDELPTLQGSAYEIQLPATSVISILAAWLLYLVLTERFLGGTLGKLMTGLRVRGDDGAKITLWQSVIRNLARAIDAFPWAVPYLTAAISTQMSSRRQRLGDRWASTYVVTRASEKAVAAEETARRNALAAYSTGMFGTPSGERLKSPPLPPPPSGPWVP